MDQGKSSVWIIKRSDIGCTIIERLRSVKYGHPKQVVFGERRDELNKEGFHNFERKIVLELRCIM